MCSFLPYFVPILVLRTFFSGIVIRISYPVNIPILHHTVIGPLDLKCAIIIAVLGNSQEGIGRGISVWSFLSNGVHVFISFFSPMCRMHISVTLLLSDTIFSTFGNNNFDFISNYISARKAILLFTEI